MAGDVKVTFSGSDDELRKVMARQAQQLADLEDKFHKLKGASKDSLSGFEGAVQGGIRQLAGMAAGVASVHSAMQLVTAEYDRWKQRQQEAGAAQVGMAAAGEALIQNLVGASRAQVRETFAGARALAQRSGVSEEVILRTLGSALSASGGDAALSMRAVELGTRISPNQPDAMALTVGGMLDVSKLTGGDLMQGLGLLGSVAGLARMTGLQPQMSNIPRALIGGANLGFDPRFVGQLFAGLSGAAADPTGESTGTAMITFLQHLRDFKPLRGVEGRAALERLQHDPALAQRFLRDYHPEPKFLGPLEQLLLAPEQSIVAQKLRGAGIPQDLTAAGEDYIARMALNPYAAAADRDRRLAQVVEQTQLDDAGGRAGIIRSRMQEAYKAAGFSGLGSRMLEMRYDVAAAAGRAPEQAALELIAEQEGYIRAPTTIMGTGPAPMNLRGRPRTPTDSEARLLEILGRLEQALRRDERQPAPLASPALDAPPARLN